MFYSQKTNGFYHPNIHGENLPDDVVPVSEEVYASLIEGQAKGLWITSDGDGRPMLVTATVVDNVPKSVTMRQARLALLKANLLDSVETAISAIPDTVQQKAAKIEWEYAQTVDRDSPFTQQLASGLNLTSEQLDILFLEASKL